MSAVNMLQAKSSLSRLVEAIEQGQEHEIIIARNGRPAAKLVPVDAVPAGQRIGLAKGKFEVPSIVPALGTVICLTLIAVRLASGDWRAPALAGGMLAGMVALHVAQSKFALRAA